MPGEARPLRPLWQACSLPIRCLQTCASRAHRSPPARAGGTAGRWAIPPQIAINRPPPTRPIRCHDQPNNCTSQARGRRAVGPSRPRLPPTVPHQPPQSAVTTNPTTALRRPVDGGPLDGGPVPGTPSNRSPSKPLRRGRVERVSRRPGISPATLGPLAGHPQSPRLAPRGFYSTTRAGSGFRRGGMPERARGASSVGAGL